MISFLIVLGTMAFGGWLGNKLADGIIDEFGSLDR